MSKALGTTLLGVAIILASAAILCWAPETWPKWVDFLPTTLGGLGLILSYGHGLGRQNPLILFPLLLILGGCTGLSLVEGETRNLGHSGGVITLEETKALGVTPQYILSSDASQQTVISPIPGTSMSVGYGETKLHLATPKDGSIGLVEMTMADGTIINLKDIHYSISDPLKAFNDIATTLADYAKAMSADRRAEFETLVTETFGSLMWDTIKGLLSDS